MSRTPEAVFPVLSTLLSPGSQMQLLIGHFSQDVPWAPLNQHISKWSPSHHYFSSFIPHDDTPLFCGFQVGASGKTGDIFVVTTIRWHFSGQGAQAAK